MSQLYRYMIVATGDNFRKQRGQMKFRYSLNYDEAFEAFQRLATRGNPRARKAVAVLLLAVSAGLIVMYALYPTRLEYFFLPILCLGMYFGIMYYPTFKASRGARQVARVQGTYQVEIGADGFIRAAGEEVEIKGDKDARAFESAALFVIRPDRTHSFCLPKRIMNESEAAELREILRAHLKKFTVDPC